MSVQRLVSLAVALCAAAYAGTAGAVCYVVYDRDGLVAYRSQTPPVDLSRSLHETLPAVAPGGSLVFTPYTDGCELEVNRLPLKVAAAAPALAPARAARRRAGAQR